MQCLMLLVPKNLLWEFIKVSLEKNWAGIMLEKMPFW